MSARVLGLSASRRSSPTSLVPTSSTSNTSASSPSPASSSSSPPYAASSTNSSSTRSSPPSPAHAVRGPKVQVGKGKTRVLTREELQQMLDAIDRSSLVGKRDYAWLTLAASSWCRVSALSKLVIKDYEHSGKRSFIHIEEKGGKVDRMPVHHKAQEALDDYIAAAGFEEADSPIFQSLTRSGELSGRALVRNKVWEMVRRRAKQAQGA